MGVWSPQSLPSRWGKVGEEKGGTVPGALVCLDETRSDKTRMRCAKIFSLRPGGLAITLCA